MQHGASASSKRSLDKFAWGKAFGASNKFSAIGPKPFANY